MTITPVTATNTPLPIQATPLVANGQGVATPVASPAAGLSFSDVLDAVNPLQHIPVLSNLYRAATGGHISAASQVAGDTLYGAFLPGGIIGGLASSVANVAVKAVTGEDIGQMVVGAVSSTPAAASVPAATPLVANSAATQTTTSNTANSAAMMSMTPTSFYALTHNGNKMSAQYQRAQIHDNMNGKLLKMAV